MRKLILAKQSTARSTKLLVAIPVLVLIMAITFILQPAQTPAKAITDDDTSNARTQLTNTINNALAYKSVNYTPDSYIELRKAIFFSQLALKDDSLTADSSQYYIDSINDATASLISQDITPNNNRLEFDCNMSGENAPGRDADKICWVDWDGLAIDNTATIQPIRINVPGGYIDADMYIGITTDANPVIEYYQYYTVLSWAYNLNGHKAALGFQPTNQTNNETAGLFVTLSNIRPTSTDKSQHDYSKLSMVIGDMESMSENENTNFSSDQPINKLTIVDDDNGERSYNQLNSGWGTNSVSLAGGAPEGDEYYPENFGAAVGYINQPGMLSVNMMHFNRGGTSAMALGVYVSGPAEASPVEPGSDSTSDSGQYPGVPSAAIGWISKNPVVIIAVGLLLASALTFAAYKRQHKE